MKRIMKLSIIFSILLSLLTNITYADLSNPLKGHWSEKMIDQERFREYLKLFKNNADFRPDEPILFGEYITLLYKSGMTEKQPIISKEALYEVALKYFESQSVLSSKGYYKYDSKIDRKEAIFLLERYLVAQQKAGEAKFDSPFTDIDKVNNEYQKAIGHAFSLGIINGSTNQKFNPDSELTKIQAVIIMERLRRELFMIEQIPFKVLESKRYYSWDKPMLIVEDKGEAVHITVTRQFSNPGFAAKVTSITRNEKDEYVIKLNAVSSPNDIQLQVISYVSTVIEIPKSKHVENSKILVDWGVQNRINTKVDM